MRFISASSRASSSAICVPFVAFQRPINPFPLAVTRYLPSRLRAASQTLKSISFTIRLPGTSHNRTTRLFPTTAIRSASPSRHARFISPSSSSISRINSPLATSHRRRGEPKPPATKNLPSSKRVATDFWSRARAEPNIFASLATSQTSREASLPTRRAYFPVALNMAVRNPAGFLASTRWR